MRTTLTLDDDVAAILKKRARQRGVSFKEMVNAALRAGLGEGARSSSKPPRTEPHSFGMRPGIDMDKLGQLVDELEVDELANKTRRGKA